MGDRYATAGRTELDADPYESLRALLVVQERIVADRLASVVSAAGQRDAAGRALAGIVLDTIGEKEELEDIVLTWAREEVVTDIPVDARSPEFRDLIASLLEVKRSAARRYRQAARSAPSPHIAERLEALARQAGEHAAILLAMLSDSD